VVNWTRTTELEGAARGGAERTSAEDDRGNSRDPVKRRAARATAVSKARAPREAVDIEEKMPEEFVSPVRSREAPGWLAEGRETEEELSTARGLSRDPSLVVAGKEEEERFDRIASSTSARMRFRSSAKGSRSRAAISSLSTGPPWSWR
jgi:hypothetical protein